MNFRILVIICFCIFFNNCKKESEVSSGPYFPKVKFIIQQNCLSCHSSSGSWQGRPTQFDTDEQITRQFASIKSAVADPITPFNKRMPFTGMLNQDEIDNIVKWWQLGGKITD